MTAGPGGAGEFVGSVVGGLFQHAYVVADLDAAQQAMRATLGCGEFAHLPATDLEYRLRGEPMTCALEIGFARSGDVQIELIQPVRGQGIHAEFLAARGPGMHHLGYLVDDLEATLADAARLGVETLMRGAFGALKFAYVDTAAELGVFTELVEDPEAMMFSLMPWR